MANAHKNNLLAITTLLIIPSIATFFSVKIFSPFFRPIWFDEFLQFAFGSASNLSDLLKLIYVSGADINHGQTGVLGVLQYLLLQINIPIMYALRAPSVIATWLMFLGCILAFRAAKLNLLWSILGVCVLVSQSGITQFSAEARPYIFLCAGISLTLAYYMTPQSERHSLPWQVIGYVGVLIGCLFHPYFSIYWAIICLSTMCSLVTSLGSVKSKVDIFINHINPRLLVAGSVVYFSIGGLSWLRPTPPLNFNPFQFLQREELRSYILDSHIFYIFKSTHTISQVVLSLFILIFFLAFKNIKQIKMICCPLLLTLFALSVTLVLIWISNSSGYWILPRQWVGSMYLTSISSILILGGLIKGSNLSAKGNGLIFLVLFILIALYLSDFIDRSRHIQPRISINSESASELSEIVLLSSNDEINWLHLADERYSLVKRKEMQIIANNYVELANINILNEKRVNPLFSNFYCTVKSIREEPVLFSFCRGKN